MVTTKQINIKNRTYFFFDDMIYIKNFDPSLLKLDKKSSKDVHWICHKKTCVQY